MKRVIGLTLIIAAIVISAFGLNLGVALAHSPAGADQDTPLGSNSNARNTVALDNFGAAHAHSQVQNSEVRNPQCGAHYGSNGIHPPGNP